MIVEKIAALIFLLFWIWGGIHLIINFDKYFGPHPDDPAETSGSRSFGQPQIWTIWIGMILVIFYFLFFA